MRLHLTQERIDLHAELVRITNGQDPDLSSAEKDFVRVAKQYGEVAGITYAAWRQVGVDTVVLDQAGIMRTGPTRPDASRVRRPAEGGTELDAEPLLPRTEPTSEPATEAAPAADPEPAPVIAEAPAELPLEAPAPTQPKPARKPQKEAAKAPTKPKPAPPKEGTAEPAANDTEGPKLRRKRIAD